MAPSTETKDLPFLNSLNPEQLEATTSDADALQILAGPGSGKTRVLTSRVAWLVDSQHIEPSQVIVVTFTNKAANEMRQRLATSRLLGERSAKVVMGTFHSTCAMFLRRYADKVELNRNFAIADASTSKSILQKVLKNLDIDGRAEMFLSEISKAKSHNIDCDTFARMHVKNKADVVAVYISYEERLRQDNYLDFDDLLVWAHRLLSTYPVILSSVEHVLVDEFQDTNAIQYSLLKLFASARRRITVVGDPDQSIFGWRNADTGNFLKVLSDFPRAKTVWLERNYRSTGPILRCAMHVVSKDTTRIPKSLYALHLTGPPVCLLTLSDSAEESAFVVREIRRLRKHTRGLVTEKDVAILLRSNALSREVEEALVKEGVGYRIVGGYKFFDRAEIKDILCYLRLAANPSDSVALARVINVPKRGVGDATVDAIMKTARKRGWTEWRVVREAARKGGKGIDGLKMKEVTRKRVEGFVETVEAVKGLVRERTPIESVIDLLVDHIAYEAYLKGAYQDWEARMENVQELASYASRFSGECGGTGQEESGEILDESSPMAGPLARFLEATSLSTNTEETEGSKDVEKVTIMTLHTSKGLEWPCVFIIGCEDGLIPHVRSMDSVEQMNEESRLLYVGMTRAKCFLYCLNAQRRLLNGQTQDQQLSPLLCDLPGDARADCRPVLDAAVRRQVATVLGSPVPDESVAIEEEDEEEVVVVVEEVGKKKGNGEKSKVVTRNDNNSVTLTSLTPEALTIQFGGFTSARSVSRSSSLPTVATSGAGFAPASNLLATGGRPEGYLIETTMSRLMGLGGERKRNRMEDGDGDMDKRNKKGERFANGDRESEAESTARSVKKRAEKGKKTGQDSGMDIRNFFTSVSVSTSTKLAVAPAPSQSVNFAPVRSHPAPTAFAPTALGATRNSHTTNKESRSLKSPRSSHQTKSESLPRLVVAALRVVPNRNGQFSAEEVVEFVAERATGGKGVKGEVEAELARMVWEGMLVRAGVAGRYTIVLG